MDQKQWQERSQSELETDIYLLLTVLPKPSTAISASKSEMETGKLSFRQVPVEKFELEPNEELFDIAVAVRVGALDGRHPEIESNPYSTLEKN